MLLAQRQSGKARHGVMTPAAWKICDHDTFLSHQIHLDVSLLSKTIQSQPLLGPIRPNLLL